MMKMFNKQTTIFAGLLFLVSLVIGKFLDINLPENAIETALPYFLFESIFALIIVISYGILIYQIFLYYKEPNQQENGNNG